jgi:hypothetical protein
LDRIAARDYRRSSVIAGRFNPKKAHYLRAATSDESFARNSTAFIVC